MADLLVRDELFTLIPSDKNTHKDTRSPGAVCLPCAGVTFASSLGAVSRCHRATAEVTGEEGGLRRGKRSLQSQPLFLSRISWRSGRGRGPRWRRSAAEGPSWRT